MSIMTYTYIPKGVCSRKMTFELDDDTIVSLSVEGGCNGNLKGIGKLCEGMKAEDIADRLEGNTCGIRSTSCPDQLSKAIREALATH